LDEAVVATVDTEAIAELIAGRLRDGGIAARVRFDSQTGLPRQISPQGLGFGPGAFRVAVAAHDAGRAREMLRDAGPSSTRPRPVVRAIATILLIGFLLSFIPGVISLVNALFGRSPY
jgi:hypothetical protein